MSILKNGVPAGEKSVRFSPETKFKGPDAPKHRSKHESKDHVSFDEELVAANTVTNKFMQASCCKRTSVQKRAETKQSD